MGVCSSKSSIPDDPSQMSPRPIGVEQFHRQQNSSQSESGAAARTVVSTPVPGGSANASESGVGIGGGGSVGPVSDNTNDLLYSPGKPLPTDPAQLRQLVEKLQHALASRELTLREKEKELQSEKTQRVQSATGVLNQAMKIIRPSTTTGGGSGYVKRDSVSVNSTNNGGQNGINNSSGISPSLIQLHEKQKAAAAEVANAVSKEKEESAAVTTKDPVNSTGTTGATANQLASSSSSNTSNNSDSMLVPVSSSSSASVLPIPASTHELQQIDDDSDSTLRRELMDVLLAFAENELIAPNAERSFIGGSSALTMNNESFSAVINQSSLDQVTKQWLTAEFTRDQPTIGAGTRQRHVSVVNTHRSTGSSGGGLGGGLSSSSMDAFTTHINGGSSLYAQSKLLINPDLIDIQELESWEFDSTSYTNEILVVQAFKMFESFDLLKRFNVDPIKFTNFLMELSRNYIASNPYHNFLHGMDVLHCCWMYLKQSSVVSQARLRSLDLFAFLLSAVCHDLGHPGSNNTFQIQTRSELAMIYNDVSVLENYHVASAFRILAMSDCSILSNLTREEWSDARKIMISCILATDMSHHFEMVAKLDHPGGLLDKLDRIAEANKLNNQNGNPSAGVGELPLSPVNAPPSATGTVVSPVVTPAAGAVPAATSAAASPTAAATTTASSPTAVAPPPPLELTRDEIIQLLNVLLHSADISNPGKPWKVAKIWGDRIQQENFAQGDLERKKGLPVSPFMDRSQENQPQTSIMFIDFIVAPLCAAIVRAFPTLVPLAENLIKNRKIWHQALLDRLSNSMLNLTGAALLQKETERKSLTNKAQVFRNCFVLPMRKIAEGLRVAGASGQTSITDGTIGTDASSSSLLSTTSIVGVGSKSSHHHHHPSASHAGTGGHTAIAEGHEEEEREDATGSVIPSPSPTAPGTPGRQAGTNVPAASAPVTPAAGYTTLSQSGSTTAQATHSRTSSSSPPPFHPAPSNGSATQTPDRVGSPHTVQSQPSSAPGSAFSVNMVRSHSGPDAVGGVLVNSAGGSSRCSPSRSSAASATLEAAADKLFQSVSTIVKRRHSMLDALQRSGSIGGTAGSQGPGGSSNFLRPNHAHSHKQSLSQPHTPTLSGMNPATQRAAVQLTHDPLHLILPSQPTGPRRVSLSQMAQQMIVGDAGAPSSSLRAAESSDGAPSLEVDASASPIGSDTQASPDLLSPVLSPESRAVVDALANKPSPQPQSKEEVGQSSASTPTVQPQTATQASSSSSSKQNKKKNKKK